MSHTEMNSLSAALFVANSVGYKTQSISGYTLLEAPKLQYITKSLIQSAPRATGGRYWECRMLHRVSIELRMRLVMAILLIEI